MDRLETREQEKREAGYVDGGEEPAFDHLDEPDVQLACVLDLTARSNSSPAS